MRRRMESQQLNPEDWSLPTIDELILAGGLMQARQNSLRGEYLSSGRSEKGHPLTYNFRKGVAKVNHGGTAKTWLFRWVTLRDAPKG